MFESGLGSVGGNATSFLGLRVYDTSGIEWWRARAGLRDGVASAVFFVFAERHGLSSRVVLAMSPGGGSGLNLPCAAQRCTLCDVRCARCIFDSICTLISLVVSW